MMRFRWLLLATLIMSAGLAHAELLPEPPGEPRTPQEWMAKGNWYLYMGEATKGDKSYIAAVNAYTKIIEVEPNNANAWFNRGQANYYVNGQQAKRDISRAIELDPKRFHFLVTRGNRIERDDNEAAVADLRKALAIDPVLWGMYWRSLRHGLMEMRAEIDYVDALMRDPKNRGIYFHPKKDSEKEYQRWISNYYKMIESNPYNNSEHYESLGLTYFKRGEDQKALDAFSKVIKANDLCYGYRYRGMVHTAMKQWDKAKKDFEAALNRKGAGCDFAQSDLDWLLFISSPEGTDRWLKYGQSLAREMFGLAPIVAFGRAIELDPKNVAAYLGRAEFCRSYLPKQSIADYSTLLKLDPSNAKDNLFRRGEVHGLTGQLADAINDWEAAARLGHAEAKQRAAEALDGVGMVIMGWVEDDGEPVESEEAVETGEPVEAAESPDPEMEAKRFAEQQKRLAEKEKQRLQRALDAFNRALKIFPDHALSLRLRGQFYAQTGENKRALEDYGKVIRLAPKDAEAYMGRAGVYRAMNDEKRAIADWKKAAELGNEDAQWLLQEKGVK